MKIECLLSTSCNKFENYKILLAKISFNKAEKEGREGGKDGGREEKKNHQTHKGSHPRISKKIQSQDKRPISEGISCGSYKV